MQLLSLTAAPNGLPRGAIRAESGSLRLAALKSRSNATDVPRRRASQPSIASAAALLDAKGVVACMAAPSPDHGQGQISRALDRLIRRWLNTDMQIGEVWAFRDHPKTVGEPLHRVEVVRLGGPRQQGDAHIRFLDGEEAGLQEWVSRTQLVVPWEESSRFARDDENWQKIIEQSPETRGKVEFDAARLVIEVAQLKRLVKLRQGGICEISDPEKIVQILGLGPDALLHEPFSFVDRLGNLITPWSATLLLVQGIARHFSDEIFQATQRRYETLKDQYDRSWQCNDNDLVRADHLIRLVREWCGEDANERHDELQALRAEVERLGILVERAIAELRRRKAHSIAATIEHHLGVLGATDGSPRR